MVVSDFILDFLLTLKSIVKILFSSKFFKQKLPRESENEGLIILGNGPSLNININRDREFIYSKKKLCVNGFAISENYEVLKPDFYLIADLGFWIENPIERIKLFREEVINAINRKTTWTIILLLPFEAKKSTCLKVAFANNPNIQIKYFNKTTIVGFEGFRNWCYRLQLGIPRPQNVLIPGIVLGINLGFREIYILGADHSWHEDLVVTMDNTLCLRDAHFYDNSNKLIPLIGYNGKKIRLFEQFESLTITFRNYHLIENYANFRGAKVFNASEKSFIDAFERINPKELNTL